MIFPVFPLPSRKPCPYMKTASLLAPPDALRNLFARAASTSNDPPQCGHCSRARLCVLSESSDKDVPDVQTGLVVGGNKRFRLQEYFDMQEYFYAATTDRPSWFGDCSQNTEQLLGVGIVSSYLQPRWIFKHWCVHSFPCSCNQFPNNAIRIHSIIRERKLRRQSEICAIHEIN